MSIDRRLHVIDLEAGRSRKQFKEEISRALNDFGMVARKDLCVRMADLMHKFDNESFVLCGRRYKLSIFRDIKVLKLRTSSRQLFRCHFRGKPGGPWLVVLKKDPVRDMDLTVFLKRSRSLSPSPPAVSLCLCAVWMRAPRSGPCRRSSGSGMRTN